MLNYGKLSDINTLKNIKLICDLLGYGKNKVAHKLIIETLCSETVFGYYKDTDKYDTSGIGIGQFDSIGFEDTKKRSIKNETIYNLLKQYGIDLNLIDLEHLRYNVFLSVLFIRLKYRLIKDEIPLDLNERYYYYKKYYNSLSGKANKEGFIFKLELFYKNWVNDFDFGCYFKELNYNENLKSFDKK